MLKNYKAVFFLALVAGIVGVILVASYINSRVGLVDVVVAKQAVEAGHVMTKDDLALKTVPHGGLNQDVLRDPQKAIGLSARGYIPENTPLRASMLVNGPSNDIPAEIASNYPGRVALGMDVNIDTTAGFTIRPGALVDVSALKKTSAQQVAIDVPVLKANATNENSTSNSSNAAVVLALTLDQRQKILDARAAGSQFVLTLKGAAAK